MRSRLGMMLALSVPLSISMSASSAFSYQSAFDGPSLSEWKDLPREPMPKPWEGRGKAFLSNELPRRFRAMVPQARGRVRAWRSLKEKRRAWGIA